MLKKIFFSNKYRASKKIPKKFKYRVFKKFLIKKFSSKNSLTKAYKNNSINFGTPCKLIKYSSVNN